MLPLYRRTGHTAVLVGGCTTVDLRFVAIRVRYATQLCDLGTARKAEEQTTSQMDLGPAAATALAAAAEPRLAGGIPSETRR